MGRSRPSLSWLEALRVVPVGGCTPTARSRAEVLTTTGLRQREGGGTASTGMVADGVWEGLGLNIFFATSGYPQAQGVD